MRTLGAFARTLAIVAGAAAMLAPTAYAHGPKKAHKTHTKVPHGKKGATATSNTFSFGQLDDHTVGAKGCGTNIAGEPAIHVSPANNVFLSSEVGLGGGTDVWRGLGAVGGSGASGCGLEYRGQPNAVDDVGASGGDTDLAIGSQQAGGTYPVYVASLNLATIAVAHSNDDGTTFQNVPLVAGVPVDDRPWIAAYGATTSLLTYHDIATNNIDVLRSDDGGTTYVQVARAIPDSDYKSGENEHGNIVIDRRNTAGTLPGSTGAGFWAYQSFVAPSDPNGSNYNEAFVAVSNDGGFTWTDKPVPCSKAPSNTDLDHNFPDVSVGPGGDLWYAWSDDHNVFTAVSTDHGDSWTCSGPVSTNTTRAIFPWLAATSAGEDLVFYGSQASGSSATWYVEFAQNLTTTGTSWSAPQQVVSVHRGDVCEGGISCNDGRQLLDDFGVDTDQLGWAHIAYSHDSPDLGGPDTYTGYAVQTGGTQVGAPN